MAETKTKTKKKAPAPKGAGKKSCTAPGCKRAYRAKGLCFFHYKKWRRGELEARSSRYDTCAKPDCKKKVAGHGLCQDHYDELPDAVREQLSGMRRRPRREA